MYTYSGPIIQPHLGKTEYWRQILDDMDEVIWRPYRFIEPWVEDDDEMVYFFSPRFLLGWVTYVLERFCFRRVVRQFGRWQGIPQGTAHYARVQSERAVWGLTLEYEACLEA